MEDNIKELLRNFEKASEQLDQALDTIKSFSGKMEKYFAVSKDTENAIETVSTMDFGGISETAGQITKNLDEVTTALSELETVIKDNTLAVKESVESIQQFNVERINDLSKSTSDIKKEIKFIGEELATISEAIELMSQNMDEEKETSLDDVIPEEEKEQKDDE